MKYFFVILLPFLCFVACNENAQKKPQVQDSVSLEAPKDTVNQKDADRRAVKYGVYQWNIANNKWDTASLRTLIAPKTKMYGTKMTTNEACTFLYERFKQYSHYAQKVARDFEMENISDNKIKASFIRIIDWGEQKTELPTSLVFEKIGEKWLIVEEYSAEKFAKKEETKEVLSMKFENCDILCESVIKSTKIYAFFMKNNPSAVLVKNNSESSLIHSGKKPEGQEYVVKSNENKVFKAVFFVVYPQKMKLSAYEVNKEKETQIPFDAKFIPHFQRICGAK